MKPLGGHMSIHEGLRNAPLNARALKHTALQIMLGQDQAWQPIEVEGGAAADFREMTYGLETYVHLPYLINPCEGSPRKKNFYRMTFRTHLRAASNLGAKAVILHPGFKKDLPEEEAFRNCCRFLEESYEDLGPMIYLETDAGSKNGSAIGSPEFINQVITKVDEGYLGMCLDTAHMYARGVNLFDDGVRGPFLTTHHRNIKMVHLNAPDPEVTCGGHRDRHNTPFEEFSTPSKELILDLTSAYPCILERRSLSIQEQDTKHIRSLQAANYNPA